MGEQGTYPTRLAPSFWSELWECVVWFIFLSFIFTTPLTSSIWLTLPTGGAELVCIPAVRLPPGRRAPPPAFSRSISNKVFQKSVSSFPSDMSYFLINGSYSSLVSQSRFCYYSRYHMVFSLLVHSRTLFIGCLLSISPCALQKTKIPFKNLIFYYSKIKDKDIYPAENLENFKTIKNKIIHNPISSEITF